MNELEEKLRNVLEKMNSSFNIEVGDIINEDDEMIAQKLTIAETKNDGSEFLESFCSLFGPLITMVTNEEKELVYQEDTGLVIQHKKIIDDNLKK